MESPTVVGATNVTLFSVRGAVKELKPDGQTIIIRHEAMTMAFRVKEAHELTGLQPGDEIAFRLLVTEAEC